MVNFQISSWNFIPIKNEDKMKYLHVAEGIILIKYYI